MRTLIHPPAPVRDIALLLARIVVGIVLVAHGWQKVAQPGFAATVQGFVKMGVPLPEVSVAYAAVAELIGGILIIVGALTPLAALLVVLDMFGAFVLVHVTHGVFVTDNGWELVGSIAATCLALIGAGAGRFSVDELLGRGRTSATAPVESRESAATTV